MSDHRPTLGALIDRIDEAIRERIRETCVQGEPSAQHVRSMLDRHGFDSTSLVREPDLHDPGTFSFIPTPPKESPLNSEELITLLQQDSTIDVAFAE